MFILHHGHIMVAEAILKACPFEVSFHLFLCLWIFSLFPFLLTKVDDALWHLADNCSSSGSSSGSSSSSASSSACSSSSSSESATSSTNSGLCVRVRCFGQLLRRSAIRFREAGAFIGETSTEDGQLMWNALKPGGLASIDRGGGIMKSSKASLLHVSSSSGLHVPAREWVSLLYKVVTQLPLVLWLSLSLSLLMDITASLYPFISQLFLFFCAFN